MPLNVRLRYGIIATLTLVVLLAASLATPFGQNESFHNFADTRTLLGVPNCLNVVSNLPFVLIGIIGLVSIRRDQFSIIYAALFSGILLTGLGSAYYHFHPDNNTLVYDRIPMTIVFTSFLAATIAERMSLKWGVRLLFPLIIMGIASVLWWHYTELKGGGDLRFYMVVQFFPMILIPLIFLLFPVPGSGRTARYFLFIVAWYIVAKVFEHYDEEVFSALRVISGHSIKHLVAAISTWYIFRIYRQKQPAM